MRSLFVLVLIGALALVGTAAAYSENFQNGADIYLYTSYEAFSPWGIVWISPVETEAAPYLDTFRAKHGSSGGVTSSTAQAAQQVSWIASNSISGGATKQIGATARGFGSDGRLSGTLSETLFVQNTGTETLYNPIVFRAIRVNGKGTLYANDVQVSTGNNNMAAIPYYWTVTDVVDDLIVGDAGSDVVGVFPRDWYIVKDIISPSLTGLYNEYGNDVYNSEFHVSYSSRGSLAGATISIDGDHQVQAIPQPLIKIRDYTGNYIDSAPRAGIATFNITQFTAAKSYGRHTIRLTTAAGTTDEEFWYQGSATTETAITYDRDIYAPQDSVQITSTIGSAYWNSGLYSYYGAIYDVNTRQFRGQNWTITQETQVHSTAVSTELFPLSGEYHTLLYAVDASGNHILLDTDLAQIYANKVVVSGTVWDAQQGTVLSGAAVSLAQSGMTQTQTTGSDGRFEFGNLQKDAEIQVSAGKTGFVTAWSNSTPREYKRYEIEIALAPTAPTHTGEAVFGTVRSYPMGSFVESPAVRVLKDGALVNSTTGTAKGFYLFNNLDASTTYTIEVEKDGFVDYSNAVVTGSGGASLTQLDPWLIPYYDLTVHLKDAVSLQPITVLMAVSVGGQSKQTSTGTAVFNSVQYGAASVAVVGSGYKANETPVTMTEDQEITLYVMPLAVVPTTNIPLTPTPTPAIVSINGTVYNGMTGGTIAGVNVSVVQGSITRTATSSGAGAYTIPNIQNGVLTTVNATAAGYTHTAFSFTPAGSASYIVDLYMYRTDESENPTIRPVAGMAGAGGTVLGGPYHELIESPTVTASNGTWSGPATLSPDHVWYFTNLEPGGAYNFTASASGFVTRTVQATMGGADSFTVVPIVLDGVYDVTITVKDADTYALILQPVHLSLSNGQTGNTSTGSYTFTNLEYATYVVSGTSEGYTGGGISFLAYGDHTEYVYLAKKPAGSDSTYEYAIPPKPVEILCRNIFGMPLAGVTVTAQGGETTLPDRDLLGAFFGWGDKYSGADLANASMTGTTSSDGGITFMMTDALKYNVTFTDPARGISETVELMPHDTQYMFILGSMGATPAAGMPNMTLWADGAEGASPTLRGYYSDPAGTTSALYFVVERVNGTVRTEVNNQSLGAVQTANPSFAVNHTTGAMYSWGFRATTPDRGALQQWNGITLHSRLVELPIEESAYFWVSMCLVFLFAGLFSGNNIKYGFVAFPMFCGVLWYIGWLNIAGITLGIVMVLGILMYLAKVQVA